MSTQPIVKTIDDDAISGAAKEIFSQMTTQNGSVPKWMRVMANCEDIFVGFFTMFKAIMDDTPLKAQLKWKVAYIISEENKCEYCVSVSEMQLKNFGMEINHLDNLVSNLTEREKLAVKYAKACNNHAYKIDPKLSNAAKAEFGDEGLVELTSVVGLFNFINRFNDALRILPD